MTDVWTTVGIVCGIFMVKLTNWQILDPLMAIAVAFSILYTGGKLIIRSVDGLMDTKVTEKELTRIRQILDQFIDKDINYHALYTRQAASKRFISFHLLVPGDFTVSKAHEITKTIEFELTKEFAYSDVFIHMEPIDDPDAHDDFLSEYHKGK